MRGPQGPSLANGYLIEFLDDGLIVFSQLLNYNRFKYFGNIALSKLTII